MRRGMKLVVLGANGRTGAHVVRGALEQGAHVTAVVRSAAKSPPLQHRQLEVVIGDPCQADVLAEAFHGREVAVSTLGGRRPTARSTSIYPDSARAMVAAAARTGLRQMVVTSSALLFPEQARLGRILAAIVPNVVRSAQEMEKILSLADLDVVVARCGFLSNEEASEFRAARGAMPEGGGAISRRSLARFLLSAARASERGFSVYGVAGPRSGVRGRRQSSKAVLRAM